MRGRKREALPEKRTPTIKAKGDLVNGKQLGHEEEIWQGGVG